MEVRPKRGTVQAREQGGRLHGRLARNGPPAARGTGEFDARPSRLLTARQRAYLPRRRRLTRDGLTRRWTVIFFSGAHQTDIATKMENFARFIKLLLIIGEQDSMEEQIRGILPVLGND